MFEFQNLEVYKKAKVFHLESKQKNPYSIKCSEVNFTKHIQNPF
jgi:hypothetical protein